MNRPVRWLDRCASLTLLPVLLALAACGGEGDGKGGSTPVSMEAESLPYGAECTPPSERASFSALVDDTAISVTYDIREYHDCQRLPIDPDAGGDPVYSPVLQIWATPTPDDLGTIVFQSDDAGHLAAIIRSYGTGTGGEADYAPLGIDQRDNCLYIKKDKNAWYGRIGRCAGERPKLVDVGARVVLDGRERPIQGPGVRPVPTVARWDRGRMPGPGQQTVGLIGIRCGLELWCRFGPSGAQAMPSGCGPRDPWCDEQFLAVAISTGAPVKVRPARNIHGTIMPTEDLGDWEVPDFECTTSPCAANDGWREVATASIRSENAQSANNGPYKTKLNLLESGPSTIAIRRVPGAVGVPEWQARIVAGDGSVEYRGVDRHDHSGVLVPATARWAWSEQDEGVWVRCGSGCCTVTDYAFQP